jgi:hypothetical protein
LLRNGLLCLFYVVRKQKPNDFPGAESTSLY